MFTVKQGDSGIQLIFNLKKSDGAPFDLTGSSVNFVMAGGRVYTKISMPCTIDDAINGQCSYVLSEQDTAVPGKYRLEVVVEKGGGRYTTVTQAELLIEERL